MAGHPDRPPGHLTPGGHAAPVAATPAHPPFWKRIEPQAAPERGCSAFTSSCFTPIGCLASHLLLLLRCQVLEISTGPDLVSMLSDLGPGPLSGSKLSAVLQSQASARHKLHCASGSSVAVIKAPGCPITRPKHRHRLRPGAPFSGRRRAWPGRYRNAYSVTPFSARRSRNRPYGSERVFQRGRASSAVELGLLVEQGRGRLCRLAPATLAADRRGTKRATNG